MKEKKNNPNLAVNLMLEIEKEIMHQECFILSETFAVFRSTGKY